MKLHVDDHGFALQLTGEETQRWANRDARWPNSLLAWHSLFVEFDQNGLAFVAGGFTPPAETRREADELMAIVADHVADKLPAGHPCKVYFAEAVQS